MKTNRPIFYTALLAAWSLMLLPAVAGAQGLKTLHGHVPAAISQLHLKANGHLPSNNTLDLSLCLPLRNTNVLNNLLGQIYDPSSTNYHHYLTPEEFTMQFGPSEKDYETLIAFAQSNGLTVVGTHPNRMLLDVSGKVSNVENAFHVSLQTYRHPSENRNFFAPNVDPSVPPTLPVIDISGLDNYRRPHTYLKFKSLSQTGQSSAATGSGPGGEYIGNDFRNAYVPGTSLNGAGQTVALVQFDGYSSNDIAEYESMAGRTNVPLQNVLLDGFSGLPTGNGGEVEVSLDIEMVVSMAPALAQVIVYEGNPYNFFPNDVLNRIATDDLARQISCSWGWSGGPSPATDQIFQEMALQGQTFFHAVGDSDAFTTGAGSINGVDNPYVPLQPSDSPYITQVGGTTLTMNGGGSAYSSETVWNWDVRYGSGEDGVGSCGGVSSYYPIPSWQTNINMAIPQGSTTFRNSPDVALTADDVFVIADSGTFYLGVGGTSCASPLWAGFTALINQQATNRDMPPVGFINPALYAIASKPNYTNDFHDITTGNNTWSGSPNLYYAVSNYDLCTGLGTPNGTNLINALTGVASGNFITHLSAPLPAYGTTLRNLNGGNPNGNWELFVQDDQVLNSGFISNGWSITLTTANPVGYVADNALTMNASATIIPPSGDVTFTIGVTNYGPSLSSNVVVQDTYPSGFTLASPPTASQGSVFPNGISLSWSLGNLTNMGGAQLTLTMQAPSAPEQYAVNSAGVSADTSDQNTADNAASVSLTVANAVSPTLNSAMVGPGGKFQLTVSGGSYPIVIQASTNLVSWVNVFTNNTTAPFIFTDSVSPGYPTRFYRALEEAP